MTGPKQIRLYSDIRAFDGIFASGWRTIRKGGRIKCNHSWYQADALKDFVGELAHVRMDYWEQGLEVSYGEPGNREKYCTARVEKD